MAPPRLSNSKVVSQQESPIIVVVQDSNPNKICIKQDPNGCLTDDSDEDSHSSHLQPAQVAYYENKEDVTDSELIWCHRRPTENDYNATEYFLQLRASDRFRSLFGDKKFGKYKLWSEIAEEMNTAGFYVGEGREAAERCRQKFSNLEKGFLNYMKLLKAGHRTTKNPPQFYDLLYSLVDHEDKLYKQEQNSLLDAVRDSLHVELVASKETVTSGPSRSGDSDHGRAKKPKQQDEIVALLTKQHAEMMKLQRDYLDKLDRHLTMQNEQRERMLNSFIEVLREPQCKCKRKRSSSNDSDQTVQ